jgi:hypothetical protein
VIDLSRTSARFGCGPAPALTGRTNIRRSRRPCLPLGARQAYLDGEDVSALPLIERKTRLAALLSNAAPPLHFSDYHKGEGAAHRRRRNCRSEGIVRRANASHARQSHLWQKSNV